MRLCETNYNFTLTLEGSCAGCPMDCEKKKIFSLADILPKRLCPFAYFSLIPYWVSLTQGAWFQWRESKHDVIYQCPKPNGVVFLLKNAGINGHRFIEAKIVNAGGAICPYRYSIGEILQVGQGLFCPALFPSLWSQLDKMINPIFKELNIDCCISPVTLKAVKP